MNILSRLDYFYNGFQGEKGSIGKSYFGEDIKYFVVKKTDTPKLIFQYSIHAREYITTYLALKQIQDFAEYGEKGTAYFIPMLNPDGVKIALTFNPLYKANGRGVDLNVNFDAKWGTGASNLNVPSSENYIGEKPFSELETRALRDFTLRVRPDMTVSYHSKGEEIYWQFNQTDENSVRDKIIAEQVSINTGYPLVLTPFSAGGYKDWCIEKLKIPALTIEVGSDGLSHPIGVESLPEIYLQNKGVVKLLTEIL